MDEKREVIANKLADVSTRWREARTANEMHAAVAEMDRLNAAMLKLANAQDVMETALSDVKV